MVDCLLIADVVHVPRSKLSVKKKKKNVTEVLEPVRGHMIKGFVRVGRANYCYEEKNK